MDPSTSSKRRSVIDPSQSAMGTPGKIFAQIFPLIISEFFS